MLYDRFLVRDRDVIDRRAYQRVFELAWDECPTCYADCPSTKAEYCLRSVFNLEPIPELCRYEVAIGSDARAAAKTYLESICGPGTDDRGRYPAVLLHYQANTSTEKKNLPHELARRVCEEVIDAGYVPVVLDWDKRSPLPFLDGVRIFNPGADSPLWGGIGTGDCEILAALVAQSSLFIGVDSGPLHVAGAVSVGNVRLEAHSNADCDDKETRGQGDKENGEPIQNPKSKIQNPPTPVIAVWTGHHPLHYFCPADHVTHLVPEDHASRLRGNRAVGQAFFEKHFRYRTYRLLDDALPAMVREVLSNEGDGLLPMNGFWVRRDNAEQDLVIVRDIAEQDSYRLAELATPGGVAVDVGAHIGVFSRAFKKRHPAARVVAVECCPENITALRRNVGDFASIVPAALTYEREVALLNAVYPGCVSTGGSTVISREELNAIQASQGLAPGYWLDGRTLATVTLEQVMAEQQLDHIDVLKLDCEGSEFSILENTSSLDCIGAIVGEYHGRERFLDLVARRFQGWQFRILHDGDPGTFWLVRPCSTGSALCGVPGVALDHDKGTMRQGDKETSEFASRGSSPRLVVSPSPCPLPSDAAGEGRDGLSVDVARGVAVQIDRSQPLDYDDAYFDKYVAYEGTLLSNRLGRLRTALVKKYCRTVLDIGIGCGTFLKQWAIAGCGCRESAPAGKQPCSGCGQAPSLAAAGKKSGDARQTPITGYGYDVNPRGIAWLRERHLFVDPYDYLPTEIEGLTFWDSLEHLPEPADLLARLRVGMYAFVSLPIFSDLSRLAESKHYRPGEHFHYFTHEGLLRYMSEQGFDLLESNAFETVAGRERIETFVFRKVRGPLLPPDWHRRAIGDPLREIEPGRPLVLHTANGIGDLCWLMVLAGSLKRRLNIPRLTLELQLAGDERDGRAVEFARRFTAVDEVTTARFDIHLQPVAAGARLRYVPNGYAVATKRRAYTLIVNPWLEWQGRLENFMPEVEPQWGVLATGYRRDPADERTAAAYSWPGRLLGQPRTGHIAIHLCSRSDNSTAGMNRGGLWSLGDWLALLERLRTISDLPIYILGAKQDADYSAELLSLARRRVQHLYDLCGATSTTLAIEILRQSSLVVSFASGLAVAACYLGVPTVAFWNAEGHSTSPHEDVWFSDGFATNWAPPAMLASGLYYPAIYGRDTPETVFNAIARM